MVVEADGTPESVQHNLSMALTEHEALLRRRGRLLGAIGLLTVVTVALVLSGVALRREALLLASGAPLVLIGLLGLIVAFGRAPRPWDARKAEALNGALAALMGRPRPHRVRLVADLRGLDEVEQEERPGQGGADRGRRYGWRQPWLELEVHDPGGATTRLRAVLQGEREVQTAVERVSGASEHRVIQNRTNRGREYVTLAFDPGRSFVLEAGLPRRWQEALEPLGFEVKDVRLEGEGLFAELNSDVFMIRTGGEFGDERRFGEEELLDGPRLAALLATARQGLAEMPAA